jgi:hypothetical protein
MELASCQPSGTQRHFEVGPRSLENLCTPVFDAAINAAYRSSTQSDGLVAAILYGLRTRARNLWHTVMKRSGYVAHDSKATVTNFKRMLTIQLQATATPLP